MSIALHQPGTDQAWSEDERRWLGRGWAQGGSPPSGQVGVKGQTPQGCSQAGPVDAEPGEVPPGGHTQWGTRGYGCSAPARGRGLTDSQPLDSRTWCLFRLVTAWAWGLLSVLHAPGPEQAGRAAGVLTAR